MLTPQLDLNLICPKYLSQLKETDSEANHIRAMKQGIDFLLANLWADNDGAKALATIPQWLAPYLIHFNQNLNSTSTNTLYTEKLAYYQPLLEHYLAKELLI